MHNHLHRRRVTRRVSIGIASLWAVLVVATGIVGLVAQPAAAASSCGGVDTSIISGDACDGASLTSTDSADNPVISILVFVMQILTGAVGVAAVGTLIYAGILYSAAGGESGQVQKAKTIIKDTVIGIVCYAGMILILNFVIPGGVFGQQSTTGGGTSASPGGSSSPGSDGVGNGKPGSTYNLALGSWNTYYGNSSNVGTSAKGLMSSLDILGMHEVHFQAQRDNIKAIESSVIGVYFAPKPKSGDTHMASYPIVYNKTKLTVVKSGYKNLGSVPGLTNRYAVYIKFQVKSTGQQFYFVNTHLPPGVEGGGKPKGSKAERDAYKIIISSLATVINGLKSNKVPIFLVGDFNVNYRADKCETSWFPCSSLHAAGLKSAFESTKLAGIPKSYGTHSSGSRLIDYVWAWDRSDTKVTAASVVSGGSGSGYKGSDHKPSTAKVTISTPSSSTSNNKGTGNGGSSAISLSGVENFRDVSTLTPTVVKAGVLYRSAKLQNATSKDVTTLTSLLKNGIIVDLRAKEKVKSAPDKPIPGVPDTNYDVTSASDMKSYVKVFVTSASDRKKVTKAITDISNAQGNVLIHCTAGKDRTGWTVSMIMYILGANDAQVMQEYLKSRDAGLPDFRVESDWLNEALKKATNNHKRSIMDFITSKSDGLGLDSSVIARIKEKFGAK